MRSADTVPVEMRGKRDPEPKAIEGFWKWSTVLARLSRGSINSLVPPLWAPGGQSPSVMLRGLRDQGLPI